MEIKREETTILKGIAICLMVWHHIFGVWNSNIVNVQLIDLQLCDRYVSFWVGDFSKICVAMFAILSGYGIGRKYFENSFLYNLKCR